jgi:hypothetical protein
MQARAREGDHVGVIAASPRLHDRVEDAPAQRPGDAVPLRLDPLREPRRERRRVVR